jgi:TolB protein
MKKKIIPIAGGLILAAAFLIAQQSEIKIGVTGGQRPAIAIPDFRGAGDAQRFMNVFNETLWNEVQQSGMFKMTPKSMYPLRLPQQPADFKPPSMPTARPRRGETPQPVSNGPWLTDWSSPPVSAQYLAFGYTATQNDQLVLFGWLYDVTRPDPGSAQIVGKLYFGPVSEDGARKVAREFAADILQQFGGKSLLGTRVYFVSDRTGHKEIWSMDYDGSNQKAITHYNSISTFPCVSPDSSKIAFTTWYRGNPGIFVHSLETGRKLIFYNQPASLNAPSDFTPDSKQLLLYSTAGGSYSQIFIANADGSDWRRISSVRAIEVEAKVNPKTKSDLVFVSGRSGPPQIYRMNLDGADIVRLTTGEGEAVNPSWHPDGTKIAFAWTRGFEPGNYNIFIMDVATRDVTQLTHGMGRNENPVWAPDGLHMVFSSKRGGRNQIFTMLADGTQQKQLTTLGNNEKPVWANASNF